MNRRFSSLFALACLVAASQVACAQTPSVEPAVMPNMTVTVQAGQVAGPNGNVIKFDKATLSFDPPQVKDMSVDAKAPQDKAKHWDSWQPWPTKHKDSVLALSIKPNVDEQGTLILGGLFRQIQPDSIRITAAGGGKTFKMNQDYVVNPDWGQIGGLNGKLGEPGKTGLKVSYKMTLQRLDLVQVSGAGKLSVKKGTSRIVCPQLPEPDAGCVGLAGIYIAPWPAARNPWYDEAGGLKAATPHAISKHEILPIHPAAPVEPVNAKAVARTLAKLRGGKPTTIAFTGASITLGAEAPAWWKDQWTESNLSYMSRVIVGLRKRFPKAEVKPVDAVQGGTTTKFGLQVIDQKVMPSKPDLLLIAFGGNDCAGPVGGKPNNPPDQYKEDMRAMVRKGKEAGAEVMIVVTMQQNPWLQAAKRWPEYREKLLELSREEDVALADVYTEWVNMATRGIPPFSQLHNWINHPGGEAHQIYSDTILRFFEAK